MTPLKPQTTKLNPKPDPIPTQHTSEIIQQHLQRDPKMNLNEPAPPLALKFLKKMFPALLCKLHFLMVCIYSVFTHRTTQRLYATQLQKLRNVPPVQIFARTCIPANSPKRQFCRNLQCFLHICNTHFEPQKSANHPGRPCPLPPPHPLSSRFRTLSVIVQAVQHSSTAHCGSCSSWLRLYFLSARPRPR